MEEIKKVYFKYRTEAVEARSETKMYKDLLNVLLSYINFDEKNELTISTMATTTFNLFKTLKNDLNLESIHSNDEFLLKNKSVEELVALKKKIDSILRKK